MSAPIEPDRPAPPGELWSIGPPDTRDAYREPGAAGEVVWRAGVAGQLWPNYQASEADPAAGYRLHPYAVEFALDREPAEAFALAVEYVVISPRLPFLEVRVNGTAGRAYLRPHPSQGDQVALSAALHTSIHAEGTLELAIPGRLLRRGQNRLELVARDDGEVRREERPEAVKRLDRMANGAGLVYRRLGFREAVAPEEGVRAVGVHPTVLYRRAPDGTLTERCHVQVELGGARPAGRLVLSLRWDGGERRESLDLPAAELGHLRASFDLPDGEGEVTWTANLGDGSPELRGSFRRRRKWTVHVAPHAHVDIGYTHRQWEVAERMCLNVDQALAMLDADERRPGEAPAFGYHLDCAWPLEAYWATRSPERRARLAEAMRAGRVGVSGTYADLLTNLCGLEDLVRNAELAHDLIAVAGASADFAAAVDVASLSGSWPLVLEATGIRYLVHASNQDRGPFRLNGGLHRRSPFWWHGTHGGRVLVWLAKMYCELRKVCGSPPVLASGESGLELWLDEFERADYLPDSVLLYGQEADNTDLDPQPADFVRRWNAAYAFPRLVPGAVSGFFRDVEARFAERLPAYRGDGGAYWEDGAGSSMAATADARFAQATLPAAERLETLAAVHGDGLAFGAGRFREAWRELLLYDEHTWGAFLSATAPDARLARDQAAVKESFARQARAWAERLVHAGAVRHGLSWNAEGREVVVFNPHSFPVSGLVEVEVALGEGPLDPSTREPVPARRTAAAGSQATLELWVDELEGFGYRRYPLDPSRPVEPAATEVLSGGGPVVLENEHHRLVVDSARGFASSWVDRRLGRELVAADAWGFGQFLYARGGEGTRLVSNSGDLPVEGPEVLGGFELIEARRSRSPLGQSLTLRGTVEAGELEVSWVLPDRAPWIDLGFRYRKDERRAKEAVYVAFPFELPGARVRSDSQLGWVDWHRDELPGGCKEWLPLQSAIHVSGAGADALVASPDVPLFCVGDVVRGRWPRELDLSGGRVLSYVLNNYWHTNYRAAQGGELSWRYRLASGASIEEPAASRLGWAARRPPYALRLGFQDFREPRAPYADAAGGVLAQLDSDTGAVAVSTLRGARSGQGVVARLQNLGGADAVARLAFGGRPVVRAVLTDLLERELGELEVGPGGAAVVPVPAWGLATLRLELDRS